MNRTAPAFLWETMSKNLKAGTVLSSHELPEPVLKHLKVLRIKSDEVLCFLNGQGLIAKARCTNSKNYSFELIELLHKEALVPELELCLAAPKAEALALAVQQGTEIGLSSLRLLEGDFSQLTKGERERQNLFDRLQRISDAATEQCTRPWRMEVHGGWSKLETLIEDTSYIHVLADEGLAESELIGFAQQVPRVTSQSKFRLYIGPEGGWSPREKKLFEGRALKLGLGALILRVPTAVVAATHFLRLVAQHAKN